MWYKLELFQQVMFFLIVGYPILAGLIRWIYAEIERSIGPVYPLNVYNHSGYEQQSAHQKPLNTGAVSSVKRTFNRSGLLAGEREKAPRATFFGKIDGNEVAEVGDYEPKFLNSFEKNYWNRIKGPILKEEGAKEAEEPPPTHYEKQNDPLTPVLAEKDDKMSDSDELASLFKAK